jgi:hydrogenase maturation protease
MHRRDRRGRSALKGMGIPKMGRMSPPNGPAGKIVIIGVGNLLLKDEGVGVHVAQELQKKSWPLSVEVHDGGVAGIGLLDFFAGASKVLLIDAAEMNLDPGALVRFTPEEVAGKVSGPRFSAHDIGLLEVLELAKALAQSPAEVVILGIQPKEISWGMELSPEVQASIPRVVETVLREILPVAPSA